MNKGQETRDKRHQTRCFVFILGIVFCLGSPVSGLRSIFAAEPKAQFQQANDLYRGGKFTEAAKIYEDLSSSALPAQRAVLFYNLANSYYRSGQINQAIWNYERTLFLNPWFADARYNLNAARAKIEYKIEDHRNAFMHLNDLVFKWVKKPLLAWAALLFSLIFLISCGFWLRNPNRQHFWAFPRGEAFAVCLLFTVLFGAKYFYERFYAEAIVLAGEAEVRYGPSMDNQSLMKLGGGLKVFIVDAREDWSRVITWNGETGWIKNSELGRVDR